jgi:hypothetical protein
MELLDASHFQYELQGDLLIGILSTLFTRLGVVIHSGGLNGGHYYSFIHEKHSTKWFEFNDSTVSSLDMNKYVTSCIVFPTSLIFRLKEKSFGGDIITERYDKEKVRPIYFVVVTLLSLSYIFRMRKLSQKRRAEKVPIF